MKRYFYTMAVLALAGFSVNAQEFDDIYYNPKKDTTQTPKKEKTKKSNYIQDFSSMDVDEYNRRGQYYESPIDTIGARAETGEDFVYTQKIQKFYNPTIVVDNISLLDDVLVNSYGNVDIVFDNGLPYFNSIYGWPGYYDSYIWMPSWRWGGAYSWSYSPVWGYDWWPAWSIGPSWAWGPSFSWSWGWGWNYGPAWAWGPSYWGPSYWGRPYYADYRPWGRQPNRPGSHWANNTRPGGNVGRPSSSRPGYSAVNSAHKNQPVSNYHRTYSFGTNNSSNRVNGVGSSSGNRGSYTVGNDGHRRYGSSSGSSSSVKTGTSSGSHRSSSSYNSGSNRSSSSSSSSYRSSSSSSSSYRSSGSSSGGRSSVGGSYGSGRSSSGSGRGRR